MKNILIFLLFIASFSSVANTIKNIQVNGLTVISLGTVLNYLPIEKEDEFDASTSKEILKSLYKTQFFQSITVKENNGIVVITVQENPIINSFNITGNEVISEKEIAPVLEALELSQGMIYNNYKIEKLLQEIEAVYITKGYYSLSISKEISENNDKSINIKIIIEEGVAAKINSLKIIGAFSYSEESLLGLIDLEETNIWSFLSSKDEYSSVVLAAGLNKIKSFYETSGYADFKTLSTNISLSDNKGKIDIIINISEGIQYTIGSVIIPEIRYVSQDKIEKVINSKKEICITQKKSLAQQIS